MKQTERKVLEDAKRSKIPVQMLANKADRLGEADLAKVMELVERSLAEVGLTSFCPPLALSARKALAGKLGDAEALAASGWRAVEALLEEQIVGRSEELKERALRRRALLIVSRLATRAARAADEERTAQVARLARAQAMSQTAAKLDREGEALAEGLARSLTQAAKAWESDVRLLVTGRDCDALRKDRTLGRYREARATERLGPPLAHALTALSGPAALTPAQTLPLARVLVRAAVAAAEIEEYEELLPALARAAIASLSEQLFALAGPNAPAPRASGMLRELAAFADTLA